MDGAKMKNTFLLTDVLPYSVLASTIALFVSIFQTNSTGGTYSFTLPVSLAAIAAALPYTLAYAVGNYVDSHLNAGEAFNPKMFVKTLVISAAMATLIAYFGLNPATSSAYAFLFIVGNKVILQDIDNAVNKAWSLAGEIKVTVTPPTAAPKS
jgi:hypothetical protein